MTKKWLGTLTLVIALLLLASLVGFAQESTGESATAGEATQSQERPFDEGRLANLTPVSAEDLAGASFTIPSREIPIASTNQYFVQLADPSLAMVWLSAGSGVEAPMSEATAVAYTRQLTEKQTAASAEVAAVGGETLANYTKLFNGLAVEITPDRVQELANLPGVVAVHPIPSYSLYLDETVPWVNAAEVQEAGVDGTGITVAVIDSGIDYTHEHLGGSGTITDTQEAIANASGPAPAHLYPTAKVVGGYDFVGSVWPNGPLMPDPNPMDDQGGGVDGHGTHVASIIGGVDTTANGGVGPGVAPGVEFHALKVCSSVSTSCSGVAIAQAYEYAADPNGDGLFNDRIDVVNLSLGSNFGQVGSADDAMINLLSALGTTVVASAGNGGDNPFILGSPSSAESAISVAQSSVPSAFAAEFVISDPITYAGSSSVVHYTWSAAWDSVITGEAYHIDSNGCAPTDYPAAVSGKIAVIWRGACNFSDKVYYAQQAGATAALVALVDGSAPFAGSQGSFFGMITIPGFNITQAAGQDILAAQTAGTPATVVMDPGIGTPLPDTMASTSSRGPRFTLNYLKPDIGAPGASVSANSGDQSYSTFGGTSGAAPMVSGAAALLLEANGGSGSLPPAVVKAYLMNNAMRTLWTEAVGGELAPISRQGAGRLDVATAVNAGVVAWIPAEQQTGISFGYEAIGGAYNDSKTVEIVNSTGGAENYDIRVTYRYPNDMDLGIVVTPSVPSINVPANGSATFDVNLDVAGPADMRDWPLFGGSSFASSAALTDAEVDGFVTLHQADGNGRLRVTHASMDAPAVDVYVDGTKVLANLAYRMTSDYLVLAPNNYLVQVAPAGAALTSAVISDTFTIVADTDLTVSAVGKLGDLSFDALVNPDNNAVPAPGEAHIRVSHFSPSAPGVDIFAISTSNPAFSATLFSNVTYSSTTAVTPVPADTYDIQVRPTGVVTPVLTLPNITLSDGLVYTAIAMGDVGALPPEQLLVELVAYAPDGISLPFHFLPRKAAELTLSATELAPVNYPATTTLTIDNASSITGTVETYPLFEINPPNYQLPFDDTNPVDLACVGADAFSFAGQNLYTFALSTYETRSHPLNVMHWVYVDLDQDGTDDYLIYNDNLGATDYSQVMVQFDLSDPTDTGSIYFFLDGGMNSDNMVLYLYAPDTDFAFNFRVETYDSYFGEDGLIKQYDQSPADGGYHTYDAAQPAFVADEYFVDVAPMGSLPVGISAQPHATDQIGMMYRFINGTNEVSCVPMTAPNISSIFLPVIQK